MPLAIDLFCGLGGWTEGLLAEGWDVIGFDIERHLYGEDRYPAQLVVQDVLTLHGSQFKSADLIVASPPCQEYSYMAMPWSRAKQIMRALRGEDDFPEDYKGSRNTDELNALFLACFRIQREASEAAGRKVPLIVENVRGAQPWVGRAAWNYGSYYLWGDVPALMPMTVRAQKFNPDGTAHGQGSWFAIADSKERGARKVASQDGRRTDPGRGARFTSREGGLGEAGRKCGGDWFNADQPSISRLTSSKSSARKHASAMIAKIPEPLARHIARVFRPVSASRPSSRSAPRDGRAAAAAADGGDTG